MDKINKKLSKKGLAILITVVSLVLVAAIVCGAFAIFARVKNGPVVMKLEGEKIRLSFYELMLSRMKGELDSAGYDVDSDEFWDSIVEGTNKTYEQYYNEKILDTCKMYLASAVIFDQLKDSGEISGLPEEYISQIDEEIALYIDLSYIGDGSEERFNGIIADFGVDTYKLREAYMLEAVYSYVAEYIYGGAGASKIGDTVKEDYYTENYYRAKHILVGNFYYKYVRDGFGNKIYFDGDTANALYDYENGERRYGDDGNYLRDDNGIEIAFKKDSEEYLYDTLDGQTRFVTDGEGNIKTFYYTEHEMKERLALAQSLCNIKSGDFATFEEKGCNETVNTDYSNTFATSNGIYMSDLETSTYTDYMKEMLDSLKDMGEGEISMVKADDGYHVFMKYKLDDGAYSESANKKWFTAFNSSLIAKLYTEKCQSMIGEVRINDKILAGARSIRDIGANTYY